MEEAEVGENDALIRMALEIGRGSLEIRLARGGKANLFATAANIKSTILQFAGVGERDRGSRADEASAVLF